MSEEAAKLEIDNRLAIATLKEKLEHFNNSLNAVRNVSDEMRDDAKEIATGLTKITERLSQYSDTQKIDKSDILREITVIRGKVDEFAKNNATVSQFHRDFIELRRVIDNLKESVNTVTTKFDIHEKTGIDLLTKMADEKKEGCTVCMKAINAKLKGITTEFDVKLKSLESTVGDLKSEIVTLKDDNDSDKQLRYGLKGFWKGVGILGGVLTLIFTVLKLITVIQNM